MFGSQQKMWGVAKWMTISCSKFWNWYGDNKKLRNIVIDYGDNLDYGETRLKFLWFVFTAA